MDDRKLRRYCYIWVSSVFGLTNLDHVLFLNLLLFRFRIHKPKEFTRDILPKYFQMSSFSSFQRQLNLYSFQRITDGPERDAYYHELFVRGQPLLCTRIKRDRGKGSVLTRAAQEERLMQYEEKCKESAGEEGKHT